MANKKLASNSKSTGEISSLESQIVNNITIGIFLSSIADGKIVYANPKCEKVFGYGRGEMIGKKTEDLYAPPDENPGPSREEIKDFIKKNGEWHGEVCRIKKNGRIFWSYSNATIIDYTKYGQVYVVVHTDITDLKIAPGSNKNTEEKYLSLFMTSREALMTLVSPAWKFTSGNPAAVKMFKAKNEAELLSYGPWKLSPARQPDGQSSDKKSKAMIAKAMKEGVNLFEWVHKRITGEEFFAEVLLSKIKQAGKVFLLASVQDITEREKEKTALEKMNKLMVDRELKMIELKNEINKLKNWGK